MAGPRDPFSQAVFMQKFTGEFSSVLKEVKILLCTPLHPTKAKVLKQRGGARVLESRTHAPGPGVRHTELRKYTM